MENFENKNPLFNKDPLPKFSQIESEHMFPALEHCIKQNKEFLIGLLQDDSEHTWDSLIQPIDEKDNLLFRIWGPISHLKSVASSEDIRATYNKCLPLISEFSTFVGQYKPYYCAIKSLYERSKSQLDKTQIKILEDSLRNFNLTVSNFFIPR